MEERLDFKRERVLIGEGMMAKVYLWNGYAYKCFVEDYRDDWIAYEMRIQNTINKTGLSTVRYYPSELAHSIKMDYINGIVLADKIRQDKYKGGLDDLLEVFQGVHEITGVDLPRLNPFLLREIRNVNIEDSKKELAYHYIGELSDGDTLCHLDFHFLNLMYTENGYVIIDWVNAKIGNPIYDYARSYVILYEFAYRLSKKYLKKVKEQCEFAYSDLQKAIYVMAIHRLSESENPKIRQLIEDMEL